MSTRTLFPIDTAFPVHIDSAFQRQPHAGQSWTPCFSSVLEHPTSSTSKRQLSYGANDKEHLHTGLPPYPKDVNFDMDGTLVWHAINFANMRWRIYVMANADLRGRDLDRNCVLALTKKLSPLSVER